MNIQTVCLQGILTGWAQSLKQTGHSFYSRPDAVVLETVALGVGLDMIAFLASSAVFGYVVFGYVVFGYVVFLTDVVVFCLLSILFFVSLDLLMGNLKRLYEVHI